MLNNYYLIRHAHSIYTPDEMNRPLSKKGFESLKKLNILDTVTIDFIYSSPYRRAIQTVQPLANEFNQEIQIDSRLKERKLTTEILTDDEFFPAVYQAWKNPTESLPGGESNCYAQKEVMTLISELEKKYSDKNIILSSHGNKIAILLNYFDNTIDFNFWKSLKTPDLIKLDKKSKIIRFSHLFQ